MKSSKSFVLISFLPALAYWYLEEHYSLKVAAMGGIGLAILEVSIEKLFLKHIHKISWFNFFLIFLLGCISFIGEEGIWFKLQPAFTGVFMGGLLFYYQLKGKGILLEMTQEFQPNQNELFKTFFPKLELHLGVFLFIYGLFMAWVGFNLSTSQWLFFKTLGFYLVSALFFIVEFFLMRMKISRLRY